MPESMKPSPHRLVLVGPHGAVQDFIDLDLSDWDLDKPLARAALMEDVLAMIARYIRAEDTESDATEP